MKFTPNKLLFPFNNQFFTSSDGSNVHYVDEGEGQTILMLHGNPTWSFLYRKMIGALKNNYRCIAVDYPGFGLSTASDDYDYLPTSHTDIVFELIEHLNLDNIIIVMQDWGGPIGLKVAETIPERISGFVIGNTWAWPLKGNKQFEIFSWIMGGPIGRLLALTVNGVWRFFMKKGFSKKPNTNEMQMYSAPFSHPASRLATSIFPRQLIKSYAFEKSVENNLPIISNKPVLILWGDKDFAFKNAELTRFRSAFPIHHYRSLNASHFWPDEQGELASCYIHDWIKNNDNFQKEQ